MFIETEKSEWMTFDIAHANHIIIHKEGCYEMSDKKIILTYSGLKELEEELQQLKIVKRKEIAEIIKEARAQGDLSENAEYDAAKEEQGEIESRIAYLEKMLKNVEVVDEEEVDISKISIGCKVRLYDYEFDEEIDYAIVGSAEAAPLQGKISDQSPVGQALIGKQVGQEVTVETPDKQVLRFKILEIHR